MMVHWWVAQVALMVAGHIICLVQLNSESDRNLKSIGYTFPSWTYPT